MESENHINIKSTEFDKCVKMLFEKKTNDDLVLYMCLQMAAESCSPEIYKGFVAAFNEIVENRNLNLGKIID